MTTLEVKRTRHALFPVPVPCWFMPLHEPTIAQHGATRRNRHISWVMARSCCSRTASAPSRCAQCAVLGRRGRSQGRYLSSSPTAAATARFWRATSASPTVSDRGFRLAAPRPGRGWNRTATYMMAMNVTLPV
jgi:hypothetical protein